MDSENIIEIEQIHTTFGDGGTPIGASLDVVGGIFNDSVRQIRGSHNGRVVLVGRETAEHLLIPRLTLAKASNVAASRAVAPRRRLSNGAVSKGAIHSGDRGRWDVGVGRAVKGGTALLVDLVRGLCDGIVVGRRGWAVVRSLPRNTLLARRHNRVHRCMTFD